MTYTTRVINVSCLGQSNAVSLWETPRTVSLCVEGAANNHSLHMHGKTEPSFYVLYTHPLISRISVEDVLNSVGGCLKQSLTGVREGRVRKNSCWFNGSLFLFVLMVQMVAHKHTHLSQTHVESNLRTAWDNPAVQTNHVNYMKSRTYPSPVAI